MFFFYRVSDITGSVWKSPHFLSVVTFLFWLGLQFNLLGRTTYAIATELWWTSLSLQCLNHHATNLYVLFKLRIWFGAYIADTKMIKPQDRGLGTLHTIPLHTTKLNTIYHEKLFYKLFYSEFSKIITWSERTKIVRHIIWTEIR